MKTTMYGKNCKLENNKYTDNLYTIDFTTENIIYTLFTDNTSEGIHDKWGELLNIFGEILKMEKKNYREIEIKTELERLHGNLEVDFNFLYDIRKELL